MTVGLGVKPGPLCHGAEVTGIIAGKNNNTMFSGVASAIDGTQSSPLTLLFPVFP